MGTRNLTVIIKNNEVKLSQYGQWDGYYNHNGRKFLEFCRENLQAETYSRERFIENVDLLKQVTPDFDNFIEEMRKKFDMRNGKEFCIPLNQMFPQFSRDTGVEILNIVGGLSVIDFRKEDNVRVQSFPVVKVSKDEWDIEYVNIIDLDSNTAYLLTAHSFEGEQVETTELIKKHFENYNKCYLKFPIDQIPSEEEVDEMVKKINID